MNPLLTLDRLEIEFKTARGKLQALSGVSLEIARGEIFGIVGETGCGKTITGLSVLRLLPKSARVRGQILFDGQELLALSPAEMEMVRGGKIAMIFQDPSSSLNPVFTIGQQIERVIRQHLKLDSAAAHKQAAESLSAVGLPDVERVLGSYPHQLSGGMQQRVMIAMALSCRPSLLIADEPTTALDVTIQAQILDLIARLKQEFGMSVLLITHDLGVVAEICRNVAVMYAGKVVESAGVDALFSQPTHPYTVGLFNSLPRVGGRAGGLKPIPGVVPSLANLPSGCAFQDRCFRRHEACREEPPWRQIAPGHQARCWKPME